MNLICISLISNAIEYISYVYWPFRYLLSVKCLFQSLAHFSVQLRFFLLIGSSLYSLDMSPLLA